MWLVCFSTSTNLASAVTAEKHGGHNNGFRFWNFI